MVRRHHHVREQVRVLNALPMLPRLVVGLAVDPPRLPVADVVLAVEGVEAPVADPVAQITLNDQHALSEGVGGHGLEPLLAEHLLLHVFGNDFSLRAVPSLIVPVMPGFHEAFKGGHDGHVRQPQPLGHVGDTSDDSMELGPAAVAEVDQQLLLLPREASIVAPHFIGTGLSHINFGISRMQERFGCSLTG